VDEPRARAEVLPARARARAVAVDGGEFGERV